MNTVGKHNVASALQLAGNVSAKGTAGSALSSSAL